MDDRIMHDPHLEVVPDHAGPHYDGLRNTLTLNGMTAEQAIQALDLSWNLNHDARTQAWDQQVAQDAAALEAHRLQQQQEAEAQADQELMEQEAERAEAEKKKPKMKDFDEAATVGSFIGPRPAQYALRRIEEFEYVELWYLTPEGCADATQRQLTQNDDAFGLTKVDDVVALRSVSSLKASKNVIPDAELSFCQMSMAKNAFIPLMTKYLWTEKSINAFAQLFTKLELHPFRQREFGERALITYQAWVRREWHDQLKSGSSFNIGVINEDLLHNIYRELLDKAQLLSLSEVSIFLSPLRVRADPLPSFLPSHLSLVPPLRHAPCTMHHAPCTMHHAPCTTHHVTCTMHHAPCALAPCTLHNAPCTLPLAPLPHPPWR